jgi:hypothetical protein
MLEYTSVSQDIHKLISTFNEYGFLYFDNQKSLLKEEDWCTLKKHSELLIPERVLKENKQNLEYSLKVGRIINDMSAPTEVDCNIDQPTSLYAESSLIKDIIFSDNLNMLMRRILKKDDLIIRRCQYNVMYESDSLGQHIDNIANPAYKLTLVLCVRDEYNGGILSLIDYNGNEHRIKLIEKSILIFYGSLPHSVSSVSSGKRVTLCVFISDYFGKSSRLKK